MISSTSVLCALIVLSATAQEYIPAEVEKYVIDIKNHDNGSSGCRIWQEESPLRDKLQLWSKELHSYTEVLKKKTTEKDFTPDLRQLFNDDFSNREQVCRDFADTTVGKQNAAIELKQSLRSRRLYNVEIGDPKTVDAKSPNLLEKYFHTSKQLSYLPRQGYMEPLVPPLRHPDMCLPNLTRGAYVATTDYLIEDFGHICRNILHRNMRTVFIDMGACYKFDNAHNNSPAPVAINTIERYRHNGIHFDHIYAYEMREVKPEDVYKVIPEHMTAPLHWINLPVSPEEGHQHNPWTMLKKNFRPDDFIVVKLDIDTPSVEMPLFQQLLASPDLQELVDVFYFEHHIQMDEMQPFWGDHSSGLTKGSITDSLEMFHSLRKAGVAAHYWV